MVSISSRSASEMVPAGSFLMSNGMFGLFGTDGHPRSRRRTQCKRHGERDGGGGALHAQAGLLGGACARDKRGQPARGHAISARRKPRTHRRASVRVQDPRRRRQIARFSCDAESNGKGHVADPAQAGVRSRQRGRIACARCLPTLSSLRMLSRRYLAHASAVFATCGRPTAPSGDAPVGGKSPVRPTKWTYAIMPTGHYLLRRTRFLVICARSAHVRAPRRLAVWQAPNAT